MSDEICKICGNAATVKSDPLDINFTFNCNYCGQYHLLDSLESDIELFETRKEELYKVSSYINEQNREFNSIPQIDKKKMEEILSINNKKIKEKFDFMMLYLFNNKSNRLDTSKLIIYSWMKNYEEFLLFYERAKDSGYLRGSVSRALNGGGAISFSGLTFYGLEYIESLEHINKNLKNIFVAFNFEDNLKEVFNTFLKNSIEKEGFNYVVVNQDNVEHNKSINDEIIVKLKSSRIVIADFTNHRNSVYFEAGYAMGMNIPIIWTCQEGHESDMSFDTRQFPHIVWKNGKDLVKQVIDRIKVIL